MTTSIWEDFGVDTAVITPDENAYSEHEQAMLALDIPARSGDDSFSTVGSEDGSGVTDSEGLSQAMEGQTGPLGEQDEDSIRLNTETGEVAGSETDDADGTESDAPEEDYEIASDSPELNSSIEALTEHTKGFQAMVEKALGDGALDAETFERIEEEYLGDGLSEETYKVLEDKGYSRTFVNAFIQGQDSLTNAYAQQLINYVGGVDQFNATYEWLGKNNPAMRDMLDDAMQNLQTGNVKAIFESVQAQRVARYGQAPARNLASRSQPQRPQAKQQESQGFASMGEMMAAMSDKRYSNDAQYRAEVERKVAAM